MQNSRLSSFVPDPTYEAFNALFPYTGTIGQHKLTDPRTLQDVEVTGYEPPSTASAIAGASPTFGAKQPALNAPTVGGKTSGELLEDLNRIHENAEMEAWIKIFQDAQIDIDFGRVLRFGLLRSLGGLVDYIAEHKPARLLQTDTSGRSAIYYAMAGSLYLYHRFSDIFGDPKFEMSTRDILGASPIHYAAAALFFLAIDFCIRAGADSDAKTSANESLMDLVVQPHNSLLEDHIRLDRCEVISIRLRRRIATLVAESLMLRTHERFQVYIYARGRIGLFAHTQTALLKFLDAGISKCVNDVIRLRVIWVHVPWTNGVLIMAVLKSLISCLDRSVDDHSIVTSGSEESELGYQEDTRLSLLFSSFQNALSVPGNSHLISRAVGYTRFEQRGAIDSASIVFPCLVLQSMQNFKKTRAEHVSFQNSRFWGPAGALIQTDRTLDEAYYPSLNAAVLERRNEDQVVSRTCKESLEGGRLLDSSRPILMVAQLWVWQFKFAIVSACSMPMTNDKYQNLRYGNDALSEDDTDWEGRNIQDKEWSDSTSPTIQIGGLLVRSIESFGKLQAGNKYQSPLDIFEIGVVQALNDVNTYVDTSGNDLLDINKERTLIHNITDIRSELAMIDDVLSQQRDVLTDFINSVDKDFISEEPDWAKVLRGAQTIQQYRRRVSKIDRDAERIEKTIQDQLNLMRTHASIRETHTSVVLSTAVIGFTVVTIIFAPLSFMTSLFALPISNLVNQQYNSTFESVGQKQVYSVNFVGTWFSVAEITALIVTGLCIWAVFWGFSINGEAESVSMKGKSRNAKDGTTNADQEKQNPELKRKGFNILDGAIAALERLRQTRQVKNSNHDTAC